MACEEVTVDVVYALPARQHVVRLAVPAGTSLREAVERSAVLAEVPPAERAALRYGIHGVEFSPDTCVEAGDRVEIYRPLEADPKAQRRQRLGRS